MSASSSTTSTSSAIRHPHPRHPVLVCAAKPGRHIGFGQPLAVLRKAHAGVEHVDDEQPVLLMHLQVDAIAGEAVLTTIASAFNGFHGILYDIGQRLRELAPVADHRKIAGWGL